MNDKLLELWKEANARRDFELSHLWQRSILLTALIVVICTVYGSLLSKSLDFNSSIDPVLFNEVAGFVTLVGLVFSLIWVMMAKGSKAWFEVQEKRIVEIEKKLFDPDFDGYKMGDDCSLKEIDACIFSTKAGKYSVSKLNIFIGIAMTLIWMALFVLHFVKICQNIENCGHCWVSLVMGALFLVILLTAAFNVWAKSSSLEKEV